MNYNDVIDFWFTELTPTHWFSKDSALDEKIKTRFLKTHYAAKNGELYNWRATPAGRLAEIIVLDQFSRNIFRNSVQSFSADPIALILAQEAVSGKRDQQLSASEKAFLYMPYMHSESLLIHNEAVKLFSQPGLELNLEYELRHKVIIERFGRYPHRNEILGRSSTAEELEFLKQEGSSF